MLHLSFLFFRNYLWSRKESSANKLSKGNDYYTLTSQFSRFSGVAELSADPEHLCHRGVSRQAGGAGAPEHPSGGGDAVLELRHFALCNIENSPSKTIRRRSRNHSRELPKSQRCEKF